MFRVYHAGMAWESRIANEALRRAVIATIMLVLLGGSTALALWMTHTRRPEVYLRTQRQAVGGFSVEIPEEWTRRDVSSQNIRELVAEYQIPGPPGMLLHGLALEYPAPQPASVSLQAVYASYFPRASRSTARLFAADGVIGAYVFGRSEEVIKQGRIRQKHIAAAVTLDGRKHLALYMTGRGDPTLDDLAVVRAIAESARDQRYTAITKSPAAINGLSLALPVELLVMRHNEGGEALYAVPKSDGPFATGRLMALQLQAGDLAEVAAEVGGEGKQATEPPNDAAAINQLLLTWLANVYQSQHGRAPGSGELVSERVGDAIVHGVVLVAQPNAPVQRTLWASSPDGRYVAIADVYAEPRIARVSHYVAKMVLARLEPTEQPDADRTADQAR